ncbi:hypothetical protein LSH36_130g04007 [Paralvinella palmiformis]|uniref:Mab-21-like HhH/H2TH-like domain-containing protein n=1 Tax=Paralvinella palmiformis TaxID=53620 RepID=A0AAD9JX97_9ANNE|nr:hypothetical protein LSH36_130g04007 [Paralvinella palmiformis]
MEPADGSLWCILDSFLPRWYLEGSARTPMIKVLTTAENILNTDSEHLSSNLKNVPESTALRMVAFGSSKFKSKIVGSLRGALNIPAYHRNWKSTESDEISPDIDILHVFMLDVQHHRTSDQYAAFVTSSERTRPGYVRVVYRKARYFPEQFVDAIVTVDRESYLSSEGVKNAFNNIRAFRSDSGPAMQGKDLDLDIDFVPCFLCKSFPPEADEWRLRDRLAAWPPKQTIDKITKTDSGLVPCGHRLSQSRAIEWRISFAEYEQMLIETLSLKQKQCYVIFKTLVKYVTSPHAAISSYCLLNTLFWTMERIPNRIWDAEFSLGLCFKSLLDLLIYYLVNHDLPQYFIPTCNLIGPIPRDHIRGILRSLHTLRTYTLSVVREFTKQYSFRDMFSEDGILHLFFNGIKVGNRMQIQTENMKDYLRLCLNQKQIEGAVATIDKCCMLGRLTGCDMSVYDYLERMCFGGVNERIFTGDELTCLAAIYALFHLTERDDEIKQKMKDYGSELFSEAQSGQISNESKVYYGAFLYKCGNYATALDLLKPILRKSGGASVFRFFRLLGKSYCPVLDAVIKEVIHMDISAQQMAYYTSIQCCVDDERTELIRPLMNEFRELCLPTSDHCLWLGYTYGRLLNEFDSAITYLYKAADFDVSDYLSTCRKTCYSQMVELWKSKKFRCDPDEILWIEVGLLGLNKDRLGKPYTD